MGGEPGIFWFLFKFSLKERLRPLDYCAPHGKCSYFEQDQLSNPGHRVQAWILSSSNLKLRSWVLLDSIKSVQPWSLISDEDFQQLEPKKGSDSVSFLQKCYFLPLSKRVSLANWSEPPAKIPSSMVNLNPLTTWYLSKYRCVSYILGVTNGVAFCSL